MVMQEVSYRRVCDICSRTMAIKVTYEDKHAPSDPCFWCSECYRMMHYDKQGELLYRHKVFPYKTG